MSRLSLDFSERVNSSEDFMGFLCFSLFEPTVFRCRPTHWESLPPRGSTLLPTVGAGQLPRLPHLSPGLATCPPRRAAVGG